MRYQKFAHGSSLAYLAREGSTGRRSRIRMPVSSLQLLASGAANPVSRASWRSQNGDPVIGGVDALEAGVADLSTLLTARL